MPRQPTTDPCSIPDCDQRHQARGWCKKHYTRWQRHGDPLITLRPELEQSEAERFWAKVDRSAEGGCWLWTGSRNNHGYGQFGVDGKLVYAHRWAYAQANGPIPDGLTLDHLCRTRACVKSSHLEPVTNRVNILRGVGPSAQNARKTQCVRGHEFTSENTYLWRGRFCRECRRIRYRRRVRGAV